MASIEHREVVWGQIPIKSLIVTASLFMVPIFREQMDKQFLLGARNQAFLTEYLAGTATVKSRGSPRGIRPCLLPNPV
jgi:ABC-type bacteriocin/lantibiotic exporter with double-glycine peptidase domain